MGEVINCLRLVWPVICGVTALVFMLFVGPLGGSGMVEIPILGLYTLKLPLTDPMLLRFILGITAFLFLMVPAFRDYSALFPSEFKLSIYFDNDGLRAALGGFSSKEIKAIGIKANWEEDKTRYLLDLNEFIKCKLGSRFQFVPDAEKVHSSGHTSFEVKPVKGWQRYRIVRAEGALKHRFEIPRQSAVTLTSAFDLLDTPSNHIQATLGIIYVRFSIILSPVFRQTIRLSASEEEIYHHNVICLTKSRFFPIPHVGRTIYLVRNSAGEVFPMGYAVNTPV